MSPEKEHPEPVVVVETMVPLWLSLGPDLPFQGPVLFGVSQQPFPVILLPGRRVKRFRKGSLYT